MPNRAHKPIILPARCQQGVMGFSWKKQREEMADECAPESWLDREVMWRYDEDCGTAVWHECVAH